MKIYCKNKACQYYKFLDEPIVFKFTKIYTPFEDDKCYGECSINPYLNWYDEIKKDIRYEGSECESCSNFRFAEFIEEGCETVKCRQLDCQHCEGNEYVSTCTRGEILIDKFDDMWICKCFSQKKIRGHMDWFSRLLNPDGTAKGGHIDDSYAEKMNKWQKTTRSYRTHMKQV